VNKNSTSCVTWCRTSIRGQALLKACLVLLFLAASLPGFSEEEGNYRIGLSSNSSVLVSSVIGYKTQEISVGQQSTINLSRAASGVIIINNEACWN